uniref:F-box protein 4 n=1 Tax=Equus caballus TaxID=9796 RepID=A0A5F5PP60_HORSE
MAGSAPRGRGGSPQSPHSDWARLEAAILSGWRSFWQSVGKERAAPRASPEEAAEEASALTRLPVSGGHRPRSRRAGPGGGASPGGLGAGASPRPTLWLAASLQPVCRRRRLGAAVARKRPGVAPWCCAAAGGRSETRPAGALVPSRVTLRVPAPRCGLGAATPRTSGRSENGEATFLTFCVSTGLSIPPSDVHQQIDVQLYILSFLSPHDLCQLGSTSHYWNETVRDSILWRYFLLRDLPSWSSVDWKSLPDLEILKKPISEVTDGAFFDYMAVYKMCCPYTRRSSKSSRPVYGAVTSFLHSLIIQNEPRFAMFGPGLEELNTSLVLSLMSSEELCPTAGLPQRQIDGIGSGVSFQLGNQHKFNILILYSTTRKERDRAREEHTSTVNKMFSLQNEGDDQQGSRYSVIPQIQKVCEVVDGFIYVANAEAQKSPGYRG